MKKLPFALSMLVAISASAQWRTSVPNLLGTISQVVGASCFRSGICWAGTDVLWESTDSGKSWLRNDLSFSGDIVNICFLDSRNGLVTTGPGEVFLTRDGGNTWNRVLSMGGGGASAVLLDSSHLLACQRDPGVEFFSSDGGRNWGTSHADAWNHDLIAGSTPGTAFLLSANWSTAMHLWVTSDYGVTWIEHPGHLDADCWSVGAEPCSQNLYVPNEEYSRTLLSPDAECEVFVSHDGGQSWFVGMEHPPKFLCGSVSLGPHTVFIQTVSEVNAGIFRTTDHGSSWRNIGGPSASGDTRLITAIDDNHLFAADINGSIWITSNSGGDSINLPQTDPSANTAVVLPERSAQLVASSCSPVDTTIPLDVISCGAPNVKLDSAWLTGSLAFALGQITLPRMLAIIDSIPIRYAPSFGTADTSWLHVRYDLGSGAHDTSVLLVGSSSGFATNPQFLHREATSAYYGQLDSLTMTIDLSSNVNLDSLWPYITDIQGTFAFDSSVVSFASYTPPMGWTLSTLTNHGNAVDFGIHKFSAASAKPLALGTALFLPATDQLATTWVTLPRFVLHVGGKDVSLCVTQNEDSHWSVKTLGELSDVKLSDASRVAQDVCIYPNPARDDCFIYNPNNGEAIITVFDVTGRSVATSTVAAHSTTTLGIGSLASGPYIVVDRVNGQISTHQISKIR